MKLLRRLQLLMRKIGRDWLPQVVFWVGGVTFVVIWGLVAFVGPGSIVFWEWTADSWQAVAIGLTGWVLAIIASKAWALQSKQAELEQARQDLHNAHERTQEAEGLTTNLVSVPGVPDLLSSSPASTPGFMISSGNFRVDGTHAFIGPSYNILSVTDGGGAGELDIMWATDYANPNYHLSITPTGGLFEILSKTVGGIRIRTSRFDGHHEDMEVGVFAIGRMSTATQPTVVRAETSGDYALSAIDLWEVLAFEHTILDLNADYDTDTFTASLSAIFEFDIVIDFASWDEQASSYDFELVTANRVIKRSFTSIALRERLPLSIIETVEMDSSDTVTFRVKQVGGQQRSVIKTGSAFRVRLLEEL